MRKLSGFWVAQVTNQCPDIECSSGGKLYDALSTAATRLSKLISFAFLRPSPRVFNGHLGVAFTASIQLTHATSFVWALLAIYIYGLYGRLTAFARHTIKFLF